jgi:Ni/Fe-hydrogenase subunit HybB-like protein
VIFAATFSIGVIDWILSLEPEWFSTIFVIYVFAGTFVQGIAAVTLATVILKDRGILGDAVNESQLHDLGKMLFAFATFWAYIWICQYLLIWYGNIPEEATYYVKRTSSPWLVLFVLNVVLNWLIPFCVLLPARAKRNRGVLKLVSAALLLGRWVDLYILIMPPLSGSPRIGILELFVGTGYGALVYLVFVRNLAKAPLVPVNDPILMADAIRTSKAWSI